jgi:hypothetical protein
VIGRCLTRLPRYLASFPCSNASRAVRIPSTPGFTSGGAKWCHRMTPAALTTKSARLLVLGADGTPRMLAPRRRRDGSPTTGGTRTLGHARTSGGTRRCPPTRLRVPRPQGSVAPKWRCSLDRNQGGRVTRYVVTALLALAVGIAASAPARACPNAVCSDVPDRHADTRDGNDGD